jgi:hypothetical protein
MTPNNYSTELEEQDPWEFVEKIFRMKLGNVLKGQAYNDALEILHGFGLKYAWRIINIFMRATHLPAEGDKRKLREAKEILRLMTEIMNRLGYHLENHNVYAEKYMPPRRHGEMLLGVHEELLFGIFRDVLHEKKRVEILPEHSSLPPETMRAVEEMDAHAVG